MPSLVSAAASRAGQETLAQAARGAAELAAALPLATQGEASQPAAATRFSAAATLIAAALAGADDEAAAVLGTAPLLPHADAGAPALARALRDALGASGLFYEAHLAAFGQGLLSHEDLVRSPQASFATGDRAEAPDAAGSDAAAPVAARGGHPPALPGIAADARPIVQQQLALLATGVFRWHGEAWPGVPMQWTVQREPPSQDGAAQDAPGRWSMHIALELPRLGGVAVDLALSGARLRARVQAGASGVELLRQQAESLREVFAGHGIAAQIDVAAAAGAPR